MNWRKLGDGFEYASPIQYNQEYRQVELEKNNYDTDSESESWDQEWEEESDCEGTYAYFFTMDNFVQSNIDHP